MSLNCLFAFNPRRTIFQYKLTPYLFKETQFRDRFKFLGAANCNDVAHILSSIGHQFWWISYSFFPLLQSRSFTIGYVQIHNIGASSLLRLGGTNFAFVRERNLKRQKTNWMKTKKRARILCVFCSVIFFLLEKSIVMRREAFQRATWRAAANIN